MKRDDRPLDIMEKEKQPAQASFEIPQLEENLSIVNWTDATVNLMIGLDDAFEMLGVKRQFRHAFTGFSKVLKNSPKWSKSALKMPKSVLNVPKNALKM